MNVWFPLLLSPCWSINCQEGPAEPPIGYLQFQKITYTSHTRRNIIKLKYIKSINVGMKNFQCFKTEPNVQPIEPQTNNVHNSVTRVVRLWFRPSTNGLKQLNHELVVSLDRCLKHRNFKKKLMVGIKQNYEYGRVNYLNYLNKMSTRLQHVGFQRILDYLDKNMRVLFKLSNQKII